MSFIKQKLIQCVPLHAAHSHVEDIYPYINVEQETVLETKLRAILHKASGTASQGKRDAQQFINCKELHTGFK
jgi:hypothetical protein